MPFNINEMRSNLTLGGARNSLFQVTLANPIDSTGDKKFPYLCRAARIPESTIGTIEVPYFGRKIPEPGDRAPFQPWTVVIINDEDFRIKNAMEKWHNAIQAMERNLRLTSDSSPALVKTDATIIQWGKTGRLIRQYTMKDAWPASISAIETNWNTTDTIEEFQVSFRFTDWQVTGGNTGNPGR